VDAGRPCREVLEKCVPLGMPDDQGAELGAQQLLKLRAGLIDGLLGGLVPAPRNRASPRLKAGRTGMVDDAEKLPTRSSHLHQAAQRWRLVQLVALGNELGGARLDYLTDSLCLTGFAVYFFFPLSAAFLSFCLGFLTFFLPLLPIATSRFAVLQIDPLATRLYISISSSVIHRELYSYPGDPIPCAARPGRPPFPFQGKGSCYVREALPLYNFPVPLARRLVNDP